MLLPLHNIVVLFQSNLFKIYYQIVFYSLGFIATKKKTLQFIYKIKAKPQPITYNKVMQALSIFIWQNIYFTQNRDGERERERDTV